MILINVRKCIKIIVPSRKYTIGRISCDLEAEILERVRRAIWTRISIKLATKVRTPRVRGQESGGEGGNTQVSRKNGTEVAKWRREKEKEREKTLVSHVLNRARPTPSCSCLPPTACNFLAKALMRGLARDSRLPDSQSRRGSSRRAASAVLAS